MSEVDDPEGDQLPDTDTAAEPDTRTAAIEGVRLTLPLAVAVFGFGVSFGAVARAAHLGWLAPLIMSATSFAGSAQFAAASILGSGGGIAAAVTAAVMLNSRYLAVGISVAPAIRGNLLRRLLSAQLVVDESWAVSNLGGGRFSYGRLISSGLLLYLAWLTGTALGVFGAGFLGDPKRFGLDVMSPVLFLALLCNQVRTKSAATSAVLGAVIALALVPFVSPGVPLIVASAACLLGLRKS